MVSAGPTGVNGEDDGEVESARGEEGLHETAERSPPAAAAARAARRRKRNMVGATEGEEVYDVALCVLAAFGVVRLISARFVSTYLDLFSLK